jgi:predicted O-methyltransferase YrrM
MDPALLAAARAAIGFMPDDEGVALHEAACEAPPSGVFLEIGTYCGKSTIYLGAAARRRGTLLFTVDHHRGSEENQPGQQYHDPRLVDSEGLVDTLPVFRRTIAAAGLENCVVAVVADSGAVAAAWRTPLSFLFIDGGHSQVAADTDLDGWSPHLVDGGVLAIHDVFPDPADGGRPPYEIYRRAMGSGSFTEIGGTKSLRILRKTTT